MLTIRLPEDEEKGPLVVAVPNKHILTPPQRITLYNTQLQVYHFVVNASKIQ